LSGHSYHHTITIIILNKSNHQNNQPSNSNHHNQSTSSQPSKQILSIININTKANQLKHINLAIKTNPITSASQKKLNPPQIIHPSSNQSNQHFIIFQPFQTKIQMQAHP